VRARSSIVPFLIAELLLLLAVVVPVIHARSFLERLVLHGQTSLLPAFAPDEGRYILVRGHRLSYPPGEMTMIAGFIAVVLIAYNGIIDRPGSGPSEIEIGLDYGYWIALACAIAISVVGFTRSIESGPRRTRKAPGTV